MAGRAAWLMGILLVAAEPRKVHLGVPLMRLRSNRIIHRAAALVSPCRGSNHDCGTRAVITRGEPDERKKGKRKERRAESMQRAYDNN